MDWNWFFSSLAQSTAAIVGIFGAFIITKILSNQTTFETKRKLMRELATKSQNLVDEAKDLSIDWYNKKIARLRAEALVEMLDKGKKEPTNEEIYERLKYSIYQRKKDSLAAIDAAVAAYKLEKREKAAKAGAAYFSMPQLMDIPNVTPHWEIESVKAERVRIDAVARNCKQHIRVVRDLVTSVSDNPEHSAQITYTLLLVLALFYLGVIYPLSFTPATVGEPFSLSLAAFFDVAFSLKGLLLTLVSLAFTAVIAMFFFMNIRMKYSDEEMTQLKLQSTLSFYSDYFEIAEENRMADGGAHR